MNFSRYYREAFDPNIIPLSQTANTPIFELSYATGVRGNQTSSVENYKKYLNTLAENFVKNIGE